MGRGEITRIRIKIEIISAPKAKRARIHASPVTALTPLTISWSFPRRRKTTFVSISRYVDFLINPLFHTRKKPCSTDMIFRVDEGWSSLRIGVLNLASCHNCMQVSMVCAGPVGVLIGQVGRIKEGRAGEGKTTDFQFEPRLQNRSKLHDILCPRDSFKAIIFNQYY